MAACCIKKENLIPKKLPFNSIEITWFPRKKLSCKYIQTIVVSSRTEATPRTGYDGVVLNKSTSIKKTTVTQSTKKAVVKGVYYCHLLRQFTPRVPLLHENAPIHRFSLSKSTVEDCSFTKVN